MTLERELAALRRLAPRRRRRDRDQGARPHRRPGPRPPARDGDRGRRGGRGREHAPPDGRARGSPARRRADATTHGGGRRVGRGTATGCCSRRSGATVVDGGETMNPSTEALLKRDRVRARGRGRRAAEQPERVHGRRGGGGARDEAGSRRALGLDPGGPRGAGRARRVRAPATRTRPRWPRRPTASPWAP